MNYGSVCSGIEAATVAWHPLGWRPAFFAEIAPFPSNRFLGCQPRRVAQFINAGDLAATLRRLAAYLER